MMMITPAVLRILRAGLDLGQDGFATAIGTSRSNLSLIEISYRNLTPHLAGRIVETFHLDPETFALVAEVADRLEARKEVFIHG